MGYIRHHTIVVECCFGDHLEKAHKKARTIFPWVSPISPESMNGSRAFFIPPDGSNEEWDESEQGNERRAQFIEYLRSTMYDGSSPLNWAEFYFGDGNNGAEITEHSNDNFIGVTE